MKISQSLIKNLFDEDYCRLILLANLAGYRTPPSDAMVEGLVFENALIGSTRTGYVEGIIPLKNGDLPKPIRDVMALAQGYWNLLPQWYDGYDFPGQVQPEMVYNWDDVEIEMHPDLILTGEGKRPLIIDIKFTATREDDRYNGWGEPENRDHLQAIHYRWQYWKMTGIDPDFEYLVFGKSGWVKRIKAQADELTFHNHEALLHRAVDVLSELQPVGIGKYNVCKKCPLFASCDYSQKQPEINTIQL